MSREFAIALLQFVTQISMMITGYHNTRVMTTGCHTTTKIIRIKTFLIAVEKEVLFLKYSI